MEHVTIISKEAITAANFKLCLVGLLCCIAIILSALIYLYISKDTKKSLKYSSIACAAAMILGCVWVIITACFFQVPTGRYRYEAIIDKENMTIAEYEEFMKAYDHSYSKDGVYYFEDWPDNYK